MTKGGGHAWQMTKSKQQQKETNKKKKKQKRSFFHLMNKSIN